MIPRAIEKTICEVSISRRTLPEHPRRDESGLTVIYRRGMAVDLLAPIRWARSGLGDQARAVLSGRDLPGPEAFATHVGNDPGLFGPASVTWRVHADLSPVVGGL